MHPHETMLYIATKWTSIGCLCISQALKSSTGKTCSRTILILLRKLSYIATSVTSKENNDSKEFAFPVNTSYSWLGCSPNDNNKVLITQLGNLEQRLLFKEVTAQIRHNWESNQGPFNYQADNHNYAAVIVHIHSVVEY